MTQKEFQTRTNIELTAEEYAKVESMYINAGDMDKDQFCKDYKKHQDSEILKAISEKCDREEAKAQFLGQQIKKLAYILIDQAQEFGSMELRKQAINILGTKEYIKTKIQRGQELWEPDKEILIDILNN